MNVPEGCRVNADGEIVAREWQRPCHHSDMALACTETTIAGLAECRRVLASATGPLARSFAKSIDPMDEEF